MSKWVPWLLLMCTLPIQSADAHLPRPLDPLSARLAVDDLQLAVQRQETKFNELLQLKDRTAELIIRRAQEDIFRQKPEWSAKRLLALTMVPAFTNHRSRATVFHWLGRSFNDMGFTDSARDFFVQSYREPRQTNATRIATVRELLELRTHLDPTLVNTLWANAASLAKTTKTPLVPYPYCRAMYRSGLLERSKQCFKGIKGPSYDQARADYFRAVIELREFHYDKARTLFLSGLKIIRANQIKLPLDEARVDGYNDGDRLAVTHIEVPEDLDVRWDDLFARTHLSLARLAASQEQWRLAIEHYQHVPPGHPTFAEATREWALVTDRIKRPQRSATILVSVGQSTAPNAPKLKQDMWRAELLGRGEAFDAARIVYQTVETQANEVSKALNDGTAMPSLQARRAMWLMPRNGDQYQTLTTTISTLQNEIDALGVALQSLETQGQLILTNTSPRQAELDRLTNRLNEIKAGIAPRARDEDLQVRLSALEQRISVLYSQDRALIRHHREVLPQQVRELRPMVLEAVEDMSSTRSAHQQLERSINAASDTLLATLTTQAGLGDLNLLIWRKEAVGRAREKAIEEKQLLIEWIESEDPGRAPSIR